MRQSQVTIFSSYFYSLSLGNPVEGCAVLTGTAFHKHLLPPHLGQLAGCRFGVLRDIAQVILGLLLFVEGFHCAAAPDTLNSVSPSQAKL